MHKIQRFILPFILLIGGLLLVGQYVIAQITLENPIPTPLAVILTNIISPTPLQTNTIPPTTTFTPSPTITPQPIFPTRTPIATTINTPTPIVPSATTTSASTYTPSSTITPSPSPFPNTSSPTPTVFVPPAYVPLPTYLQRFGVAAGEWDVVPSLNAGLPFGSFVNWRLLPASPSPNVTFWQMVRFNQAGLHPSMSWELIDNIIAQNLGAVWLLGNEPDVAWQDGVTPDQYAHHYHQAYTFIKERDPSAKIAIAGISQPTPLRRAYLDIVLNTYQAEYGSPMPIDIWNVHAFILREEVGSWGVGIPPGMGSAGARLYELEDHANLDIFRQNLIDFRAWMFARGYTNHPLVVSEYGILMPADYGFPHEVVATFMTGSFDFFLTASNGNGYPADSNRLVQNWYWYSLHDDGQFPTGNLFDPATGQLTPLGEVWRTYVRGN